MENDARWIYNDVDRGFAEAKKSGKPLLVVLRCVPCLSCVGLDAEVSTDDGERGASDRGSLLPILAGDHLTHSSVSSVMSAAAAPRVGRSSTRFPVAIASRTIAIHEAACASCGTPDSGSTSSPQG